MFSSVLCYTDAKRTLIIIQGLGGADNDPGGDLFVQSSPVSLFGTESDHRHRDYSSFDLHHPLSEKEKVNSAAGKSAVQRPAAVLSFPDEKNEKSRSPLLTNSAPDSIIKTNLSDKHG